MRYVRVLKLGLSFFETCKIEIVEKRKREREEDRLHTVNERQRELTF